MIRDSDVDWWILYLGCDWIRWNLRRCMTHASAVMSQGVVPVEMCQLAVKQQDYHMAGQRNSKGARLRGS